jgi:hypothetical protein
MNTRILNRGKRDEMIKTFYRKQICKQKVKKVRQIPCYKRMWLNLPPKFLPNIFVTPLMLYMITSNVVFFYQQVYFTYLWFCARYHDNSAKIQIGGIHRQFFENEFISIAKNMGFECYSET